MKVKVDEHKCVGHAMCAMQASEVYELADDGYNHMGEFEVKPGMEEKARFGASCCPEEAITIIEE